MQRGLHRTLSSRIGTVQWQWQGQMALASQQSHRQRRSCSSDTHNTSWRAPVASLAHSDATHSIVAKPMPHAAATLLLLPSSRYPFCKPFWSAASCTVHRRAPQCTRWQPADAAISCPRCTPAGQDHQEDCAAHAVQRVQAVVHEAPQGAPAQRPAFAAG